MNVKYRNLFCDPTQEFTVSVTDTHKITFNTPNNNVAWMDMIEGVFTVTFTNPVKLFNGEVVNADLVQPKKNVIFDVAGEDL